MGRSPASTTKGRYCGGPHRVPGSFDFRSGPSVRPLFTNCLPKARRKCLCCLTEPAVQVVEYPQICGTGGPSPRPKSRSPMLRHARRGSDVTWLRGEIKAGHIRGLGELAPQYLGMSPNDERLEPYWRLAEEFDLPVWYSHGTWATGAACESSPAPRKYPECAGEGTDFRLVFASAPPRHAPDERSCQLWSVTAVHSGVSAGQG